MVVCMSRMFAFVSTVVTVQGYVGMFVVYRGLLKVVGCISHCEVLCVVFLYSGCDVYCAFCPTCDACNCKYFSMAKMLVSSCRCCMFVSCVHPVQFVDAGWGCHRRPYGWGLHQSRFMIAFYMYRWPQVSLSVYAMLWLKGFFLTCRGFCSCVAKFWMWSLYVIFGFKVEPKTLVCNAMVVYVET